MARIAGVDLPKNKRIEFALQYIYGVGHTAAQIILERTGIDPSTKVKDLTEQEVVRLRDSIQEFKVEGDLRREVGQNIKRLMDLGTYRGIRHTKKLPVRGQRTRTNARTKRGKRLTVGTKRKEATQAAPAA